MLATDYVVDHELTNRLWQISSSLFVDRMGKCNELGATKTERSASNQKSDVDESELNLNTSILDSTCRVLGYILKGQDRQLFAICYSRAQG